MVRIKNVILPLRFPSLPRNSVLLSLPLHFGMTQLKYLARCQFKFLLVSLQINRARKLPVSHYLQKHTFLNLPDIFLFGAQLSLT